MRAAFFSPKNATNGLRHGIQDARSSLQAHFVVLIPNNVLDWQSELDPSVDNTNAI
jgi:hypothetical protein